MKNVIINNEDRGDKLDLIISFFRDILSGPLYIVVVVISVIGIMACSGYLAEATLKQKELEKKQKEMYAHVHLLPSDANDSSVVDPSSVASVSSSVQLEQTPKNDNNDAISNTVQK